MTIAQRVRNIEMHGLQACDFRVLHSKKRRAPVKRTWLNKLVRRIAWKVIKATA